jgi:hypothetical protein
VSKQTRTFRIIVFAVILALTLTQSSAWAQTGQPAPSDKKVAQALFEAQGKGTASGAPPMTLEQIVAMKSRQGGWGQVFKDMKSKGLLTQKNLGQVVSDFERRHPETARADRSDKPAKAEKPDKPEKLEKPDKPAKPERPGR